MVYVCCARYPVTITMGDDDSKSEVTCLCGVADSCDVANENIDQAKKTFTMARSMESQGIVHTAWGEPKDGSCTEILDENDIEQTASRLCNETSQSEPSIWTRGWDFLMSLNPF